MLGKRTIGLTLGLLVIAGAEARAQVAWDSPLLASPRPLAGLGIFLMDAAGGELGVMGTWRGTPGGFGLRLGLAEDTPVDDIAVFGGIDAQGTIARASSAFPLDVAWVVGAGLGAGDNVLVSVPLGLTIGATLAGEGARFTPYATPRVVLDAFFGDAAGDDLDLDIAVDLGVDLAFQPGWALRLAGTLGDRDAVAIGIVF